MSRKDTIFIAVFVNAALLIVLFLTGINRNEKITSSSSVTVEEIKPLSLLTPPKQEMKMAQGDEIDQVLKEFSKKNLADASSLQQPTEKEQVKIDFAKELKAMAAAANVQQEQVKVNSGFIEVKVKKGDALEKIARAHHSSVDEIMKCNHLQRTVLSIGQVLKIPQKQNKTNTQPEKQTSSDRLYYTVKNGDNPWTIAVKNQIKVEDLLKLNDLNDEKSRRLKPGDQLRIR